jgi:hypothetical protein
MAIVREAAGPVMVKEVRGVLGLPVEVRGKLELLRGNAEAFRPPGLPASSDLGACAPLETIKAVNAIRVLNTGD